jgi:uncharacterized lipoprotein
MRLFRFLPLALAGVLTSACALTVDKIDVPYVSQGNISVVQGAATAAPVAVEPRDGRTVYRDRVSVKKNGYGMEMANIVSSNDIPQTAADAVRQELESLGFKSGPGGSRVVVEVTRFYSDFKMGFFAGDAVAEAEVNVQIVAPDGTIVYNKHYEGGAIEPNIQLATGSNARLALIGALKNVVASIYSDPALQQALLTGRAPAVAPMPVTTPSS